MWRIAFLAMFGIGLSASTSAATSPCGIRPTKSTPKATVATLPTAKKKDAEKTAPSGFDHSAASATVANSNIEIERGCLVYQFDIRVDGHKGVEEVLIDAGTGKVLSRKHETSKYEASEVRHEAKEAAGVKATTPIPASDAQWRVRSKRIEDGTESFSSRPGDQSCRVRHAMTHNQ